MTSGPALPIWLGIAILIGFALLWIGLGWYWGKRGKSYDDHVLAGRNVGLALGTATAMATWVTTNTTMTAPQFAYQLGVWGMLGYSLAAIGLILFAPLARRIKRLMPGGYTSGDFVRTRYGKWAWRVFMVISLVYALGWLVSMGMAGGTLLEALAGIDYRTGMLVIIVVCVAYTMLGGLHAVIGTDFIQSVMILIGLVVVAIGVFVVVPAPTVHEQLSVDRPQLLNLLMPASIMFLFNQLLFGVGEIFHSNVWWSRALAFRDGVGHRAFFYGGLAWIPVPIVAGAIALAGPVMGLNVPRLDMVGPLVVGSSLGTFGAAMILIVVLASLASSLDSLLVATADLLVEDIYRRQLRPRAKGRELRRASQGVVLGLGLLTIIVCWSRLGTLGEVLNLTGAFVASTIWPIGAGLYYKRVNRVAATLAMLLGSAAGLACYFIIGFFTAALVGATVSMLIVVVGSWLWPGEFSWTSLGELERPDEGTANTGNEVPA